MKQSLFRRTFLWVVLCCQPLAGLLADPAAAQRGLAEALDEISEHYQVFFNYDDDLLRGVEVDFTLQPEATLLENVERLLSRTSFTYDVVSDRFVVIYTKTKRGKRKARRIGRKVRQIERLEADGPKLRPNGPRLAHDLLEEAYRPAPAVVPVSGTVTDEEGIPLIGVTVLQVGTSSGTVTDVDGNYTLNVEGDDARLRFSYLGYEPLEVAVAGQSRIDVTLSSSASVLDEVVVVGYGTQKKSDLTGSVVSVPKERLENVPNQNVAQAIQGAAAGVTITQNGAGATPNQSILIRGRTTLTAGAAPLIVLDGIPYGGSLNDINPNDVASIEILKDASSTAVYGSRAANGVILITSKQGRRGKATVSLNSYYSVLDFTNLPDVMNGEQFYAYKEGRDPDGSITLTEEEVFQAGEEVDWLELGLRDGHSTEHNLSVSGGTDRTSYFFSGAILDVTGLAINDDYQRITARINLETGVTDWLTLGTRTQLAAIDQSGVPADFDGSQGLIALNPLSRPFDANGNLNVFPWEEDPFFRNPLTNQLVDDDNRSYRVFTNNYVRVDIPFVPGLEYQLNTGVTFNFQDVESYYDRRTSLGFVTNGFGYTESNQSEDYLIENILNYSREFGQSRLALTGLYSYQKTAFERSVVSASGYPNDFLTIFSTNVANDRTTFYDLSETALISQMLRVNYTYDSRYLLTVTGRRDGYSAFGADDKFGLFPSVALGWNLHNESFFSSELIDQLKFRLTWGEVGNQAVSPYSTIARLGEFNYVNGNATAAGFIPSRLAIPNLGWETSRTVNVGLDYALLSGKIAGTFDYFRTNTYDLLLNRSISPIQGITSITQNLGEVENSGVELTFTTRNVNNPSFSWSTTGNASFIQNEIVSLYGLLDEDGQETDDVGNRWFIGQPIRVNFDHVYDGIWQLDEADEAALYGTQPGYVRIRDVVRDEDGDGMDDFAITPDDRQIQGQLDPDFTWGVTNTFRYKQFSLNVFIHGVHGVTRFNPFRFDQSNNTSLVRRNITVKDWWTPDNPGARDPINEFQSEEMQGVVASAYESADFVRLKDVTLAYDATRLLPAFGRFQVYVTGRNIATFTDWTGLDPELNNQRAIPLQKQWLIGLNLSL